MLTNLSPETFSRLWQSFSGLVGYDDRLTRGRSRVRLSAEVEVFFLSLHFTHCYLLIVTNYTNFNKNYKKGGQGGFEPPTSRTQSENHTPRPLARTEPRGIRTPNLRVWNPTRCHCAIGSGTSINNLVWLKPILEDRIWSNCDTLAEWLRRRPAKPLGFAREGSNPSGVVLFKILYFTT